MMKDINMDELEDLREDMEDMRYESEEINEMMQMDFGVDIDEDELDEELAGLDDEMFLDSLD
jgi:charged multivesicular body protein 5